MTNTVMPKPGERWTRINSRSYFSVLIDTVMEKQVCSYMIRNPEKNSEQEQQLPGPGYDGIDWFLANYEKATPTLSQSIAHEINVGPTRLHVIFEPQSERLSYLSVKVEHPDFPVCEMETNGSSIVEPLRYLAYLIPEEVQKMMFGNKADVPDFPNTVAHIIDMANSVGTGRHDFTVHEAKILRTKTRTALDNFDGNHEYACEELIEDLLDFGFHKPEKLIQTRTDPKVIDFMKKVWTPVKSYLKEEIEAGRSPGAVSNGKHPSGPC